MGGNKNKTLKNTMFSRVFPGRTEGFSTPQAIYKWQHGASLPTVDNLVALSIIFDVPIDAILVTGVVA